MPPKKTKKTTQDQGELESSSTEILESASKPVTRLTPQKIVPTTPEDFIRTLNNAVANIHSVFQLRDNLALEATHLKGELEVGEEMKLERANLELLKREEETFQYEFSLKKERMEKELELMDQERKEKLERLEEEQKDRLKIQTEAHLLKLKLEKEDHERKLKLEKEDFQRNTSQLDQERKEFEVRAKNFEVEKKNLKESLVEELNRQNTHLQEVAGLNHQRELELLKGELKLEKANREKFETLLQETRGQNEKLAEQLASLSREALASASTASMAGKLKELVTQLAQGSPATRAN